LALPGKWQRTINSTRYKKQGTRSKRQAKDASHEL
jgi:hypothetical protein